jgi:hypothetical protein
MQSAVTALKAVEITCPYDCPRCGLGSFRDQTVTDELAVSQTHNMSEWHHPYFPSELLSLTTLSDIHKIESHGNTLNVRVEQVLDPFTKSQAMRVRVLNSPSGRTLDIPKVVVLKLYDRRWIDDRKFDDEPWSPALEEAAQERWKAIASGEIMDDFDTLDPNDYTQLHEEEQYRRICKVKLDLVFMYTRLMHFMISETL